jgi:hypothetical protein
MEAAVTKMLAKDPENRFATTTRMVEALRRGLETGEVMEDEIARRRESIPPPSVSRVMQRLGMQPLAEPARPEPPAAPAASAAPAAPPPAAPPAPPAPSVRTAVPAVEPGVTMRAPIAPPPAKPDSVELLRKRTGTPRIGVPIADPAVVLPAQAPVALPGRPVASPDRPVASPERPVAPPDKPVVSAERPVASPDRPVTPPERPLAAPAVQASVSGVIEPAAAAGRGPAPSVPAARSEPDTVLPPSSPDDAQPRGKPLKPVSSQLNISQVWYDEGDQLSGGGDPSRTGRVRRPLGLSTVDLAYDDEPRPRRWGLIAGVGVVLVMGGVMAFALTRGGSSSQPAAVAQTAQPAAAPSPATAPSPPPPAPIAAPEPPPPSHIVGSGDATGSAPRPAPTGSAKAAETAHASSPPPAASPPPRSAPPPRRVADARPAEPRAETRAAHRASEPSYPILGSEPTRRPPSLTGVGSVAPPPTPARPTAPSLTDSPKDPYGEDAPGDGAPPERKAEFFANLGGQQLIGGDTAGAAASFQKALELDARNVTAMMGMGEIALRQGLFGDAIAHLSKASKLVPKNVKVLTLLGEAYLSSGNNAQAAAQFKKALQLDPDNARARDGYNEASSRVQPSDDN